MPEIPMLHIPTAMLTGPAAVAALDEMRFWLRIMEEHAKFVRGGLDPTLVQENLIRMADSTATLIHGLHMEAMRTSPADIEKVNMLIDKSLQAITALRNFKIRLYKMIVECRVTIELPAPLIDHVRREADFFLTMLYRVRNIPVPPKGVLGIPDGEIPTNLVPRRLIPHMGPNIPEIAMEENLFHLRIHMEHGEVLLLIAYRPKVQEKLYKETAVFEKKLEKLLRMAKRVPRHPQAIERFNAKVYPVMLKWRNFLRELHCEVVKCDVPTGQINAPALILDHMAREAEYYLTVLQIVDSVL